MSTNDNIRNFITTEILHGSQPKPLDDHEPLIESGIIDSMGIMTLLVYVEEQFSIQIPSGDLVPENFASISSIAALVDRQLGQ